MRHSFRALWYSSQFFVCVLASVHRFTLRLSSSCFSDETKTSDSTSSTCLCIYSIMDWVQIAAEEDAVTSAKDRVGFIPENASSSRLMKDTEESGASRKSDTSFGSCINVHAFSELRLSSPPPCLSVEQGKVDSEIRTGHPAQVSSCHSQLNGAGPASTSYSIGSNEKTSFRPLESTHSAQAADTSATLSAPCIEKVALVDSKASLSPEQRRLKKTTSHYRRARRH